MKEQDTRQVVASLLGVGGLVAALIALVTFIGAGKSEKLAARVKPQPQTITADDLGRHGPGDNLYVNVTNLEFGEDTLTIRSSKSSRWHRVYMPAYPKGTIPAGGATRPPLIMVHSTSISNPDELRSFAGRSAVVGIVTNPLEGVPEEVNKFKEKYASFEGKDIWIVDVSRDVPTAAKAEASRFVACLLVFVALGCFGGGGWMAYQISQTPRSAPARSAGPDELRHAVRVPGLEPPPDTSASDLAARFDPRRR